MGNTCTIFASDSAWSLGITTDGRTTIIEVPPAAPVELADSIAAAVSSFRPKHFLLALPSNWCLSATLSSENLPRQSRHQALCYRLEEQLPLSAEEFTADFIVGVDHTLAVAVPTAKLAPILEAFEARNIHIESITPTALVAAPKESDSYVLLASDDSIDLVQYENGSPIRWYVFRNSAGELALYLKALSLPDAVAPAPVDLRDVAARRAHEMLIRSQMPPINLRKDQLASASTSPRRRQLTAFAASIAFFLICLNAALLYRASVYASVARSQQGLQGSLFHDALPAQSVPIDIESRLAAEERRLHATDLPASASALLTLREALSHLPSDVRFRLTDLHITGPDVTITGESLSHTDADALAGGLRENANWEISPPRTEQSQSNVVTFTINARTSHAPGASQ